MTPGTDTARENAGKRKQSPSPGCTPAVCAIILNWNCAGDTLACLAALQRSEGGNILPLIVDNHSTDDSLPRIRSAAPDIPCIISDENRGYGGGHTLALEYAREHDAHYALLLNPDVRLRPNTIARMVALAETRPSVGALCPIIMSMDGDPDHVLFAGGALNWREGRAMPFTELSSSPGTFLTSAWATGCCLLLRLSAVDTAGGFDPSFFLYFEETDLCRRLRYAGYEVGVAAGATASHREFSTVGAGSAPMEYYHARSRIQFFVRHATRHGGSPFRLLWSFYRQYLLNRGTLHQIRTANPIARARARACLDYTLRRMGRSPRYSPE